ncbi:hypothetical protein [Runella sp.]|uniref:hypothetical protein n=1 Tax=Runella sp. TaxID=1960881 RepID=UPI003D0F1695
MKRIYHFGVLSLTVVIFLGWILNCTGLKETQPVAPLANFNNLNIITSEWAPADQWVATSVFGLPARACEMNQIRLTNSLLEQGQLYVYSKIGENVRPLPFTMNTSSAEIRYDYTVPKSSMLRIVTIGLKGKFTPAEEQKYRYVLIPNSLVKKLPVNMGNYEEVKWAFNLKD